MQSFHVEIICPLHPDRKEKVYFNQIMNFFCCNGCDNQNGSSVCSQCIADMQELYDGNKEDHIEKQIREMFQITPNKI